MSGNSTLPYRRGVGVMLANAAGEVFVGQRIDTEMPAWQMPQGGIDNGETPRDAALRELCEETGVPADLVRIEAETDGWIAYDLPDEIAPTVWNGRFRGQEQKWFLARLLGRDEDIDITAGHAEFSEWRWLPPEELIAAIVPFKRELYERVLEAFRPHLRPVERDRVDP
ncbi:MAG: RNA pyrophosphohydrolase [Roseovarius sp.]|nr:RNA pyrophosphohydrolase [Roseovarius sp.]